MKTDGNLRSLFQQHLPEAHWQAIETWSTGQGIPDVEFCFPGGIQGWIENKKSNGWLVDFDSHQIAWLERRRRMGGRAFIAVRRLVAAGPRKGAANDELWLFDGKQVRNVSINGLKGSRPLGWWGAGPASWDWQHVKKIITSSK